MFPSGTARNISGRWHYLMVLKMAIHSFQAYLAIMMTPPLIRSSGRSRGGYKGGRILKEAIFGRCNGSWVRRHKGHYLALSGSP